MPGNLKPEDLLQYVVVYEMMYLLQPRHSDRFFKLMSHHYPAWSEVRKELNELSLGAENWCCPKQEIGSSFAPVAPTIASALHRQIGETVFKIEETGLTAWCRRVSKNTFIRSSLFRCQERVGGRK